MRVVPKLNIVPLDTDGTYYLQTKPLRCTNAETNLSKKFHSLQEAWEYVFDGDKKVSEVFLQFKDVEELISLSSKSRSSGKVNESEFKFGNAKEGNGGKSRSVPNHFPAEANTRIKVKTEENAIKYFAKQYRDADHEYGMLIDPQGFVHSYKEGSRSSVDIMGQKGTMTVHNHPGGGAFSKNDLLHVARTQSSGIVAIGSKGGDYYFRKKGGHFKAASFDRAVRRAKMKGTDYDDAVRKWLKANQKKYGYTFEYKKGKSK